MPPPKKPKNGPTTVEQFLSKEEIQILGKNKRHVRKEASGAARNIKTQGDSHFQQDVEGFVHKESSSKCDPARNTVVSSDGSVESGSPRSACHVSAIGNQEKMLLEMESERRFRNAHCDVSPPRDFPSEPPRLVRASSLTPSFQDADIHLGFIQPPPGCTDGSILKRLFASETAERVLNTGTSFHDPPTWPRGMGPVPISQPHAFSPDPRHTGLGHRLTTSNTLASLMTRPAWIPYEPSRQLVAHGQSNLHLNVSPSSSIDIHDLKPAARFTNVQHHQHHQQHKHQHLDGRSMLPPITGSQMNPGSADHLPPQSEELFLLKLSPPGRADNCASSYLSSLMRQPLAQQMNEACSSASSMIINSTHHTESTPVYLHPAFQLPPSTTSSVRKNNSTSSLSIISSPPLVNSCLPGLPRHSNAKTFSPRTSPMKQSQDHNQASSFCGSNISGSSSSSAGSINNSSSMNNDSSNDNRDDIRLLDLSVKNKHGENAAISSRESTQMTPPRQPSRQSSALLTKIDDSHNETELKPLRYLNSAPAAESDDSNGYINVTSPVPPGSLMRTMSETRGKTFPVMEKPRFPVSTKLAGLLTTTSGALVPTSISLTVKEEAGTTPTPRYPLMPCKTERPHQGSGFQTREPSDGKSPKEEEQMGSPSSCMQVLPLGSAGESSGGSANLQAATSTTPEVGTGHIRHNFILGVHGTGIGTGLPSSLKQEIGGAIPGSSIQAKLCQVCNDNASGFHYGVWSCEGCKAFFKRSIQGPVDYICPATNTCTIDKHRRKSCQACRLRRCYEVGMNKGSQRKERKNSSATSGLKGKRCRADSSDSVVNSTNNGASSLKAAKRSRSASILEALQKADLPVLESYHNHNLPATQVHLLNTLIKLADRELVYLINWAKHVPGYTCLTLSDQVHLIECCWMELLLLNCAFRSMEYEGRTLVFAPDFHLERQQWALTGMSDVLEQVSAVSEQMVLHGLNKEELLLLQATVLVNAEVRHMDSFLKIQDMRQMILDVFMEVAGRHQGFGNSRHAPSILLLLTHIRQAGERGITYFQQLKMEGCVTFCDLLTEMLDAHNSSGERRRLQQQQQQHHQQHPSLTLHQQHGQQNQHPPAHHPQQQHPQHSVVPE